MHKNYFRDVIVERPALFAAMLRFNGVSADGDAATPPDGLAYFRDLLPESCLEELWRHPASRKHLRNLLAPLTPGPDGPFWDFSEESRCLALLEPATLDELALFYGASLHAPEIARTIMGKDIARLREALGERAHAYAMQRGQYRMPAGRDSFAARNAGMSLAERVVLHGREALGIIVAGWPQALQHRIRATAPEDVAVSDNLRRGVWFDLKQLLLREVAPAWAPCFA